LEAQTLVQQARAAGVVEDIVRLYPISCYISFVTFFLIIASLHQRVKLVLQEVQHHLVENLIVQLLESEQPVVLILQMVVSILQVVVLILQVVVVLILQPVVLIMDLVLTLVLQHHLFNH
jgi:hypothetical protein